MKVKEFVHSFTTLGKNAEPVDFYVYMIGVPMNGKANTCEDWYNDCPYMFDDAEVSSWHYTEEDGYNIIHINALSPSLALASDN